MASCAAKAGLSAQRLDDFVVAVNELLTNAVRHGGGRGLLTLAVTGRDLVCEVIDHGPGLPSSIGSGPRRPAADEPGGWGLWLAEELTDRFDLTTGPGGTSVRIAAGLP